MTRSVLSGMCGLTARHDALDRNPIRDVGIISRQPKAVPLSVTIQQVRDLGVSLACDDQAIERGLPDFVAFMLATGLRIGEDAAVTWDALDLDAGTVDVQATGPSEGSGSGPPVNHKEPSRPAHHPRAPELVRGDAS